MSKILVADPIAQDGIEILQRESDVEVRTGLGQEELLAAIPDYDALVVRSETKVTADVIAAGKRLQVIGRAGVGVDNIDLDAATQRGVIVVNAPLGNTISAAEHTIGLMLALSRHIPDADASLRGGAWKRQQFAGVEVRDKTLGLIGLGNVGAEVARRAKGLDMHVVAYDPFVSAERAQMLGVELAASQDEVIHRADFLSLHTKLTEETRNMIGARELAMMKPGARLINTARGELVDIDALVAAVKEHRIAGAALDVFPEEPPDMKIAALHTEGVIVTPHLGALTAEAQERVAIDVAKQVLGVLRGEPAMYAVNAPMIPAETMQVIAPYLPVAEKVAMLAAQLSPGQMGNVEIEYLGDIAQHDTTALKAAVIKGLVSQVSEDNVTIVNAALVAEHRGIRIVEVKGPAEGVYANLIRVHIHSPAGDTDVTGTVAHDGPHIVQINEFWVDVPPGEGWLVLCENQDRPGMIAAISTLLGQHDINIGEMRVGRTGPRERALMAILVDDPVGPELFEDIAAIPDILSVRVAKFN
jgi:D-3-phosphoglycerate dehydrogenase